jgi:hypothetical protein
MVRVLVLVVAVSLAGLVIAVGDAAPPLPAASGAAAGPVAEDARGRAAAAPALRRPIPRLAEVELDEPGEPGWSDDPYQIEDQDLWPDTFDEDDEPPGAFHEEDAPPDPPRLDPDPDYVPTSADLAVLHRGLQFVEEFAATIERNDGSCDRMADDLERLLSTSGDFLAEARSLAEGPPDRSAWLAREAESRFGSRMERMIGPLQGCMHSERLMAVITRFAA